MRAVGQTRTCTPRDFAPSSLPSTSFVLRTLALLAIYSHSLGGRSCVMVWLQVGGLHPDRLHIYALLRRCKWLLGLCARTHACADCGREPALVCALEALERDVKALVAVRVPDILEPVRAVDPEYDGWGCVELNELQDKVDRRWSERTMHSIRSVLPLLSSYIC
jgi:hypothetical protein